MFIVSLRFIDLRSVLVLIALWTTIRFLSETLTIANIKLLVIIPFFLFLLSIILIGRKSTTYICYLVRNGHSIDLQQFNTMHRLSIYIIVGFFFTWIINITVASFTSLGRYIIPLILVIFNALPSPDDVRPTKSNKSVNFLNISKEFKELSIILRELCNEKSILLLLFQLVLIFSSILEFTSLPRSHQLKYMNSILADTFFTPYLLPLIIAICIYLGISNRRLGIISIFTTVLYLSAVLSARGFTHFGTDVYATLYPVEALLQGNPEVSMFSFMGGKYGYLHFLVLHSISALLSLISGLPLNFYAIEASIVLIVFPSLLGVSSLLSCLLHDWRLVNFMLIQVFLINFLFIKRLWCFVSFSFMLALFLITLFIILLYKLERRNSLSPIVVISLIVTSLTHPMGLALSVITLLIFLLDEIKSIILNKLNKKTVLLIIIGIILFTTFLILSQDFVMKILYSLGLEHIFSRYPELKLGLENSTLLSLSSSVSFYVFWGILLTLCICGVFEINIMKSSKIIIYKNQILHRIFFLTMFLLIVYILTDFVFTRQYTGIGGDRAYLILSILSCVLVATFFDIAFKRGKNIQHYFYKERLKLKIILHKKYLIILLLIFILSFYVLTYFNGNLKLTSKENLSYLYIDEVKLLHEFLTNREHEKALVLSYPEVLAYARSFIPIINWWRIEGFPVIFPDSEKYGAFGGASYWKTFAAFIKYGNITLIKIHAQERKADQDAAYIIILYRLCGLGCAKFKESGKVIVENDTGFVLELPLNHEKKNH